MTTSWSEIEHERLDVVEPVLARAEHLQEDALIFA